MDGIILVNIAVIWIILIINLLLTIIIIRKLRTTSSITSKESTSTLTRNPMKVGESIPDFNLESTDGTYMTNSNISGKRTLFTIFSPGCEPCKDQMSNLKENYNKLSNSVEIMAVSIYNSEQTNSFTNELGIDYPVVFVPNQGNNFFDDFKVPGVPFYYLVNDEGTIEAGDFLYSETWKKLVSTVQKQS